MSDMIKRSTENTPPPPTLNVGTHTLGVMGGATARKILCFARGKRFWREKNAFVILLGKPFAGNGEEVDVDFRLNRDRFE